MAEERTEKFQSRSFCQFQMKKKQMEGASQPPTDGIQLCVHQFSTSISIFTTTVINTQTFSSWTLHFNVMSLSKRFILHFGLSKPPTVLVKLIFSEVLLLPPTFQSSLFSDTDLYRSSTYLISSLSIMQESTLQAFSCKYYRLKSLGLSQHYAIP